MMEKENVKFMKAAIKEAKKAFNNGEVPVGAVIVKNGEIIARAYNRKEEKKDATCHAEIEVIRKASKKLNDWRLSGCDMYITLEPCVMCSGAIVSSRISTVYYASSDFSGNLSGSEILKNKFMNHKTEFVSGLCKDETDELIRQFFISKRK